MYQTLLVIHSLFKWLVIVSLIYAIYLGVRGVLFKKKFNKSTNLVRHWTATIAHLQLVIGIVLYTQSPIVKFFWTDYVNASNSMSNLFFGIIHITLMFVAVILITIGSAKAKRASLDLDKFKIIFLWFSLGLLIILLAIPWPFSPLANRPYFRTF